MIMVIVFELSCIKDLLPISFMVTAFVGILMPHQGVSISKIAPFEIVELS